MKLPPTLFLFLSDLLGTNGVQGVQTKNGYFELAPLTNLLTINYLIVGSVKTRLSGNLDLEDSS